MGRDILSGNNIPFDMSGIHRRIGGFSAYTVGAWDTWSNGRAAGALIMPAYNIGDLLIANVNCDWTDGTLASTLGGWTYIQSSTTDYLGYRIADGTAADVYTLGIQNAGYFGGAQVVAFQLGMTVNAHYAGGAYGGGSREPYYPAQAGGGANTNLIICRFKNYAGTVQGPWDFDPEAPHRMFSDAIRTDNGAQSLNIGWSFVDPADPFAAVIAASYNKDPAGNIPWYAYSYSIDLS